MMIVQYLLDSDASPVISAVEAPRMSFADDRVPVVLALEQAYLAPATVGAAEPSGVAPPAADGALRREACVRGVTG